jgi:hypothetical protein
MSPLKIFMWTDSMFKVFSLTFNVSEKGKMSKFFMPVKILFNIGVFPLQALD